MIKIQTEQWQGCLPSAQRLGMALAPGAPSDDPPLRHWIGYCVPTYSQQGDSCVGEGFANWLEVVIRRYCGRDFIPKHRQINGYAVYFEAKRLFYRGRLAGGLQIPEGFQALKSLGWIPMDTELAVVRDDWVSQGLALLDAPLVTGHVVTEAWGDWDPQNGCLNHQKLHARPAGGHCTCRVGRHVQNGRRYYSLLNSWGVRWAWKGIGLMSAEMDAELSMTSAYTLVVPGGYARLAECAWRKGLISTPGGA